jgi:hypothetical protein
MRTGKVQYLEGLRGIAAMQVVLLHFVTGFLPYTAEHAWPPFRTLFDGHTAVYVFFLISGTVLTPSFARPGSFIGKIAKRVVRLGIPIAAAAAIATALLALFPDAHRQAAALTGSRWLAMDSSGAPTLGHLAREIGLDSLLLGYREATLFAPLAGQLPPMDLSTRRSGRCIWNFTVRCWCCAWYRCAPIRSGRTVPRLRRPHCRLARIPCSCSFSATWSALGRDPADGPRRDIWASSCCRSGSRCAPPRTGMSSNGPD